MVLFKRKYTLIFPVGHLDTKEACIALSQVNLPLLTVEGQPNPRIYGRWKKFRGYSTAEQLEIPEGVG